MRRGPAWNPTCTDDGGEGQLGTVVRCEESSGRVFVQWDCDGLGEVRSYAWPIEPSGHEVQHVTFQEIAADNLEISERTGLSSAAVTELRRRCGLGRTIEEVLEAAQGLEEGTLRRSPKRFQRVRLLPDERLVRAWFDAVPPCNCGQPSCSGGIKWNPSAERHLGREGCVLRVDPSDDTVQVELCGRCNCKLWLPRLAVDPVYDPDTEAATRFSVGSRVECNMDAGWRSGIIQELWVRGQNWGNRPTAPYAVTLDDGSSIIAPFDRDSTIRVLSSAS